MKLALIITAVVLGNFIIIIGILRVCMKLMWAPIAVAHPAQAPDDNAVTKKFQSYRIDMLNLGFCIHTTVDEQFLHLIPVKYLQKLGCMPMSIAWTHITDVKPLRVGKAIKARIGNHSIIGPAWCLELAIQEEEAPHNAKDAS